jgi:hypothetical protein
MRKAVRTRSVEVSHRGLPRGTNRAAITADSVKTSPAGRDAITPARIYLGAAAMGLASCGVGYGNADPFAPVIAATITPKHPAKSSGWEAEARRLPADGDGSCDQSA